MYDAADRAGAGHLHCALDGRADCVAEAHEQARMLFERANPPLSADLAIDAQLAVAELVTNAVRHAPGGCELEITIDESSIAVAVHDTSTEVPRERMPDLTGSGGFGLLMLRRIGGHPTTTVQPSGKTVSVTLPRSHGRGLGEQSRRA